MSLQRFPKVHRIPLEGTAPCLVGLGIVDVFDSWSSARSRVSETVAVRPFVFAAAASNCSMNEDSLLGLCKIQL